MGGVMKQNTTLRSAKSTLLVALIIAIPVLLAIGRCPFSDPR